MMTQVLEFLSCERFRCLFWASSFALAVMDIWGVNKQMDDLSLSLFFPPPHPPPLSLSLSFSLSL